MFQIENYVDKLELVASTNANTIYTCPSCGSKTLKINNKTNWWKCWSCEDNKSIRNLLSPPIVPLCSERLETVGSVFQSRSSIKLAAMPIQEPSIKSYATATKCPLNLNPSLVWYYAPTQRVQKQYQDNGKKRMLFQYYDGTHWLWGKGDEECTLWQIEKCLGDGANALCLAEGEKVAEHISKLGTFCSTAPGFGWNEDWLRNQFINLKPQIQHITYFADNDEVGRSKAELIRNSANFEKLSCRVIYPDRRVNDFYDLTLKEKTIILTDELY